MEFLTNHTGFQGFKKIISYVLFLNKAKNFVIALFIPFFAHCVTGDVLGILMAK